MKENTETTQYQAIRLEGQSTDKVNDHLVREIRLSIEVNSKPFTTTMCTPEMEEELIRGLLFSEDVFRGSVEDLEIEIEKEDIHGALAHVRVSGDELGKGYTSGRSLLSVASCGICGKTELDFLEEKAIEDNYSLNSASISSMLKKMESMQHTWSKSGGSHAAAIFDKEDNCLGFAEDIGRHNAVDKSIGHLLRSEKLRHARLLLVSSRLSYEIVAKCFTAGIPVLAAVSAPSSLAVDFAKELGITVLAFCRENRFSIYSHPERIMGITEETMTSEVIVKESKE